MPYRDNEKARQCLKRNRAKRREQGLCYYCGNKVIDGKTRCEKCLGNKVKQYYERKEKGICQRCNNPALGGHVFCVLHINKINHYSNSLKRERKSRNLCKECGKPVVKGVYCAFHLSECIVGGRHRYRDNPIYAERLKRNFRERYRKLISENKCVQCRMPLNEESRMGAHCLTCYSKKNGYI